MIGKLLIGRYLVLEQIGAGSFSKTFLTLDKYLPQSPLCVVKSLDIDAEQDLSIEQVRPLFEREARILQSLGQKSDRVPNLLAYVEEDSQLYLVEEYIDGTAIDQRLVQKQILTPSEVIAILHEVLEILQVIHAQGLIYQDLKLNHLIRRHRDGKLFLIDFGATIHVEDRDLETIALGTPGYSPIEQQNGQPTFSSDLYALGICAIQLLTGVPPDQLQQHSESGALLRGSDPVEPVFLAILDRLVASRVCDRYSDTHAVLAALQSPNAVWNDQNKISWNAFRNRIRQNFPRSLFANQWSCVLHPSWIATALLAIGAIILAKQSLSGMPSTGSAMAAQIATRSKPQPLTLLLDRLVSTPPHYLTMTANQTVLVKDRDQTLRFWDIRSGKSLQSFQLPSTVTTTISDSRGQWLIGKTDQNQVWVWNAVTGGLVHRLQSRQPISNLILSTDEQTLIAASANQIQMWDLKTGKLTHTIANSSAEEVRIPLLHTPMNELVCVTGQHRLQIVDPQTNRVSRVLAGHTGTVRQVLLSPDQRFLYSFGSDRILVWNLNTGELVKAFPSQSAQVSSAAIHNGHLVTLHTDGSLRIWKRETGGLQRRIDSLDGQALLSPDGQHVLNHGRDQHLRVLQIAFN